MKILFDPQVYFWQQYGGISRYCTEIYRLLKNDKDLKVLFPLFESNNIHLKHYGLQPKLYEILVKLKGFKRVTSYDNIKWSKNKVLKILKEGKVDVFVPTYYDTYFLESIGDIPYVLTVHDMIYELYPNYFNSDSDSVIREHKRTLIKNANKIIAVSQNTKRDLIKFFPEINENKIDVVYLSQSLNKFCNNSNKKNNKSKYLLFVGNRSLYKNFNYLIISISEWLIKNQVDLICLGGGAFKNEEKILIKKLSLENLVYQKSVKDYELKDYYANAISFVFPSEYEGFGIPILEAMACGCPVILPKLSSFPEVAGDAGIYFEIGDSKSLTTMLSEILNNVEFRNKKVEFGYKQAMRFSWEKTKEGCLKSYMSVVNPCF